MFRMVDEVTTHDGFRFPWVHATDFGLNRSFAHFHSVNTDDQNEVLSDMLDFRTYFYDEYDPSDDSDSSDSV